MKRMTLSDLTCSDTRLLPEHLGERKVAGGGVYVFEPGETAHPEARHVHDTEEVFIFIQGRGGLPVDGKEYPVNAGEVVIIEPGEDHHLRASHDDPLVTVWYLMER